MTQSRPNVTREDHAQLKQFVHLVHEMKERRFVERMLKQDHTIYCEQLENGGFWFTTPDYDTEDFRAFLTNFRRIAMLNEDPAYLFRVKNIVGKYACDNLRTRLREMKAHLSPLLSGKWVGIRFGTTLPQGQLELTSYQILNALVNGTVFHGDRNLQVAADLLKTSKPALYLWPVIVEIIAPVLSACQWLCHAIKAEQMLPDSDFPMSQAPTLPGLIPTGPPEQAATRRHSPQERGKPLPNSVANLFDSVEIISSP